MAESELITMRRKLIAVQPGVQQWRYAVVGSERKAVTLLQAGRFVRDPDRPLADQLAGLIGPPRPADRLATALPLGSGVFRRLRFPFADSRKRLAAARPEMLRQLPFSLTGWTLFHQELSHNELLTVAVADEQISHCLGNFDDRRAPLGFLGLVPFCYLGGLDLKDSGILLCVEDDGIILTRYNAAGEPDEPRLLPRVGSDAINEILPQVRIMAHCHAVAEKKLTLIGADQDSPLVPELTQAGFRVNFVKFRDTAGQQVSGDLAATAALALTAVQAPGANLNLRSGAFRLRNDWQALKKRMWLAALLIILLPLIFLTDGFWQYRSRANQLRQLRQQISQLYLRQFPTDRLVAPAPLQLQSKLKELREKGRSLHHANGGALELLLALSNHIPDDLTVDIKEYFYSDEGLRLTGRTTDFDSLSRLLAALQRAAFFQDVRILDSKQTINAAQVDFQLQLKFAHSGD